MNNIKRTIIIFISLIIANNMLAQTVQSGVVKEYNERLEKTPLNHVEITISNAASTASDENGNFILQFRTLKPGDKVNVRRIEKLGYEIFNKEALEQWYISREGKPFMIVMCKSERFKRIRDNYSRVSSASYEKQLKEEELHLANERRNGKIKEAEYEAAIRRIHEEYDQQLENLDNYVDHFARIDLSALSESEAQIIEFVQQGEIDKAIRLYEEQNLEEKYKKQVDVGRQTMSAIDTLNAIRMQSYVNRDSLFAAIRRKNETLRLAGGRANYEKIGESLKDIVLADTTYYDAVLEYAEFANSQNQFEEALLYYTVCLRTVTRNTDKCKILQKIGNLQLRLNHFLQSEKALISSMEKAQLLWSQDSVNYRIYLAEAQNSMAHLYAKMRNFDEADKYYTLALRNYRVVQNNNEDFLKEIAEIQADQCEMYIDMRNFGETDSLLCQAERNASILYKMLPNKYRPLMVKVKTSIGKNHKYNMRYDDAEASFLESLELCLQLFKNNPSAYRPQLADIYDKLSDLYAQNHIFEKSKQYGEMALAQYDTLSANSSDAYLPDISKFRNEQAGLCQMMHNYTDMKRYVEEGYKIIKELYEQYPDVYRFDYCILAMNMGISHAMHNELQEAEKFFLRSNSLADTLRMTYPNAYLHTSLSTTKNLGSLYSMWHMYDKDSLYSTLAMDICEKLYKINPVVYQKEMASMLYNYAAYFLKVNKFSEADSILRESERLYSRLIDIYPEIFMEDYRRVIRVLGIIYGYLGNVEAEEKYKLLAYEKASQLFKEKPDVYLSDYVECLQDMAFLYQENGDYEKSNKYYSEGIVLVRSLYNVNKDAYAPKMLDMIMTYAFLCWQTQDYNKAMEIQKEGTSICEQLYVSNPERYTSQMGLCYSLEGDIQYYGMRDEIKAESLYLKSLPFLTTAMSSDKSKKRQIISNCNKLAEIYKNRGDKAKALEQLEGVLQLDPQNENAIKLKEELTQ